MADDCPLSLYVVADGFVPEHTGISLDWHAVPAAGYPNVHRLVVLGVSRQGQRRRWLSLEHDPEKLTPIFGEDHARARWLV